jgi:phage tail tube protein FII
VRFKCLPPEEAFWNRDARSEKDAVIFGHRRTMTVGEAYELGIADWDELVEHQGASTDLSLNEEELIRNERSSTLTGETETGDASMREILICEVWVKIDRDGDGVPELRKFWTLGPNYYVVDTEGELVNNRPFAIFCPYPEPHTIIGQSMADLTMDVQRIKTALLRNNLDSLGLALHPRTWIVEGGANVKDVLNTEIGALIRLKAPGMVGEFAHSYVGKEAFPLLSYMDEVREQRTGQTKASNGLDADALQSSTKAAVAATLSAAQARVELLARMFAETAFRPFMAGIYQLLKENQDAPRMVRLRGQFVQVDPRPWDANMDVRVVVALGAGMVEDKINLMGMISAKQEAIMQTLGPNNPLVGLDQYRNSLGRAVELGGIRDTDSYFKPLTKEQAEQLAEAARNAPPAPDPATMLAQIESKKNEGELQVAQQKLALEAQKFAMEHELKARQLEQEFLLKTRELELKYQTDVNEAALKVQIDAGKAQLDAETKTAQQEQQAALQLHQIETTAEIQRETQRQKAELDAMKTQAGKTVKRTVKIERDAKGRASHMISEEKPDGE